LINKKKLAVVLPAYNAELTLERTFNQIPHDIVDELILTDDGSQDRTVALARDLGIRTFVHEVNKGYGANQKTCYMEALKTGADIVVMLHPDYQYDPRLIRAMSALIAEEVYDAVIGSRILGGGALVGGMPFYKYVANRCLTLAQNLITRKKLSEYHTGYRAFSRKILTTLPLLENSDDFVFDNQMLLQILFFGYKLGEVSCPTSYHDASSSISFRRSIRYGLGVLFTGVQHAMARSGLSQPPIFDPGGRRLEP
jgi:glycosyltransferase involved in cell wall biosynthesis